MTTWKAQEQPSAPRDARAGPRVANQPGAGWPLDYERKLQSIAFPALSTGAYRYPLRDATMIAVETVRNALAESPLPARVVFCAFSDRDARMYRKVLGR